MSAELKPCPFCGYALMVDLCEQSRHYIYCASCETDGPREKTLEQAIDAWNTRAPQAAPELSTASRPEAVNRKLVDALDRYLRQDETAADIDNGVYRQGVEAMKDALAARAAPRRPLTEAQIDVAHGLAYRELVASGFTGGMGGLTWDRASARAIEAAHGIGAGHSASDPIRELFAQHAKLIADGNDYAYFELARTRQTEWMAWITDRPARGEPGTAEYAKSRKVIARGQGDSPDEACADALAAMAQARGGDGGH